MFVYFYMLICNKHYLDIIPSIFFLVRVNRNVYFLSPELWFPPFFIMLFGHG